MASSTLTSQLAFSQSSAQSLHNHTSPLTNPPNSRQVLENVTPQVDTNQPIYPPNSQELRVPVQNPPNINIAHSNTPSPSHTNSVGASPNHLGGSSARGSPIPPGTNLSTDYSSTESLDTASQEHAEALLRIVTPPNFGEESESSGSEEEEEEEGKKEEGEGEVEDIEDTLTPGGCVLARENTREETGTFPASIPTVGNISVSESHTTDSGTVQEPDSPFSLSMLGLPTTPVSTPRQLAPQDGMSWWADALAETQGMEDIDALVEQLDGTRSTKTLEKKEKKETMERERKEEMSVGGSERGVAVADRSGEQEGRRDVEGGMTGECSLSPSTADGKHTQSIASSQESIDSVGRRGHSTRSSRSPSPSMASTGPAPSDNVAYIVQAGRLIRLALQYEGEQEYEEAFDLFKAAVDVLLNGVQSKRITHHMRIMCHTGRHEICGVCGLQLSRVVREGS